MPTEHDEQVMLMQWAAYKAAEYPALELLFAIPNGGARSAVTGARLRDEGVKPGVPDLLLPVPRWGHHGLFLEMKRRRGGRVSEKQRRWIGDLRAQGYRVAVCHGAEEAIAKITTYLTDAPYVL